jgi:uncharacterized protein with PQ loop repeat
MAIPLHHNSVRRRVYEKLEEFPSKDPFKRFLDSFIFLVGFLGPVFTIPQLVNVWYYHQTAGVSVVSWSAFALLDIVWIVYGIVHREKPITFTYVLWFLANAAVAVGVLVLR